MHGTNTPSFSRLAGANHTPYPLRTDANALRCAGSFGFEMETFEFLNILQAHGFPKILGVLTHLDKFKDNKRLRKTKKRLKAVRDLTRPSPSPNCQLSLPSASLFPSTPHTLLLNFRICLSA